MAFDYDEYLEEQRQYKEDNAHIFLFNNPHPNGTLTTDCVKRAITIASGRDYNDVKNQLNRYKKITKAKVFNDNKNWIPFVEKELSGEKLSGYFRMKIGEFAKLGLHGNYIASCKGHIVCIKDGMVNDTWNSSFKAIGKIWKVA